MQRVSFDNGEVAGGKKVVQQFLEAKGARKFEWNGDFDTRNLWLTFECDQKYYRVAITHKFLTDIPNDPQRNSSLEAVWKSKQEITK